MKSRFASIALILAAVCLLDGAAFGQNLTARRSTLNYDYLYGAGGDTHTGSDMIEDLTLLATDSESTGFGDSTSGVLPNGFPYSAGVLVALEHHYAISGPFSLFHSVIANAATHVEAAITGLGAAVTHAVNPGNEIMLNFTVDAPVRYHLSGNITLPGPGVFSFVALQYFDTVTWQSYFYSGFLPNGQGDFDLTGTLNPGPHRIQSVISLSAGSGESWNGTYHYQLNLLHPGDMNCDGLVNGADVGPFVSALLNPAGYATHFADCDRMNGDINNDAALDPNDIGPFVTCVLNGGCQ